MDVMEPKRTLVKRYVFGTHHDGESCLHWMDDGALLYPVGKTVVLQQPHSCHQRFLEAAYQSTAITAIAMSANKKFVAIAESGKHPQIQIIDTVTRKRRKVLSVSELDSDRYVALSFSSDGRHLVTQGGAPGWNLYYWNWERSQPLGSVSVAQVYQASQQAPPETSGPGGRATEPIQQRAGAGASAINAGGPPVTHPRSASSRGSPMVVSSIGVCPQDPLLVSVAGNGFFRFYRYTDGLLQLQPSTGIPRELYEVFSTHLWITAHNVVTATRGGSLHLIQDGRYVTSMELPTGAGGDIVTCIAATHPQGPRRGGFVAATQRGQLFIFEEAQAHEAVRGNVVAMPTAAGDESDAGDPLNYRFVCRLEVPVYEGGEQQAQPSRSRSQTVMADSHRGSALQQQPSTGGSSVKGPCRSLSERAEGGVGTGGSGKGRVGKLFELRHETQGGRRDLANTGVASGGDRTGGEQQQRNKDSLRADRVGGGSSLNGDGSPFSGAGDSDIRQDADDDNSPEAEEQRRRRRITAIALDQAEERLAVLTAAGKLYGLNFQQSWQTLEETFGKAGSSGVGVDSAAVAKMAGGGLVPTFLSTASPLRRQQQQTLLQPRAALFEPFFPFSHSGRVNGMDCSVRKPLLITSGSDHSVRVWNTQSGQLLMCQFFPLEPGAVAIHPDGLVAVVCFPDKVRIMSVLSNSLRERRTVNLRNASDVQFALGGQLFAIVHNNLVDVLNSNTCELHGQLRGHPQRIKDFQWCSTTPYPTDNRAVTCSADGMIMDWNIAEMRKQTEHTDKRFQYVAVASDDRSVWAVAAPTSATAMDVSWKVLLREIDRQSLGTTGSTGAAAAAAGAGGRGGATGAFPAGIQGNSVGDYEFTETMLTALAVAPHQRVLVAGAEDGSVKAITFPLQAGIQEAPLTAHAQAVTRMAVSFDETTLFTAAVDGSVMMWEVFPERDKTKASGAAGASTAGAASSQHHDPSSRQALNSGDEVLVTRQEMEELSLEIETLQHYIEKLKTDMESEDKRRTHEQGTRAREKAEELQHVAVTLAAEYDALHHAKVDQEQTFLDVKTEKEREAAERLEELEVKRQHEVDELEEECATLQHTLETTKRTHAVELKELQAQLATARKDDEAHYQDVLAQRTEAIRKLRRQLEQSQETNRVTLRQLELDTDAESQSVQQKQQQALQSVRERYLHLKGEGAVMRKNAVRLEREIEVRTSELQLLDGAKVALLAQLAALTHQVAQLHQDIDERDNVTEKKEKIIYSLKKQNQELEKHKYVLDHQIRELKGQIEPKQREIVELNQETKNQDTNLEEQHTNNMTLRENTEELKKDIAEQQQKLQAHLRELKRLETYRSRAERDISELAHKLQDPGSLASAVAQLYEVHVAPRDVEQIAPADPQVKHELQSQLEYLSTSVDALRRKLKADQQRHKKEVSAMMSENLSLIREIHALRAEMDQLRARVAADTVLKQKQQHQQQLWRSPGGRSGRVESRSTTHCASAERGAAEWSSAAEAVGTVAGGGGQNNGGSSRTLAGYAQSEVESNATGITRRRACGAGHSVMQRPPTPPGEIEANTSELRALRAYIEALERTLAEHAASATARVASVRLPPVDPFASA
jgi:WD40 repeat protein